MLTSAAGPTIVIHFSSKRSFLYCYFYVVEQLDILNSPFAAFLIDMSVFWLRKTILFLQEILSQKKTQISTLKINVLGLKVWRILVSLICKTFIFLACLQLGYSSSVIGHLGTHSVGATMKKAHLYYSCIKLCKETKGWCSNYF